ncbi:MAG TPA: YfiR family protein [Steroidobacteraceae bacterium]|nr:YfiR family protein [Steroidobacteraceae bacterium]
MRVRQRYAAACLAAMMWSSVVCAAESAPEYQVKAAFLFNFAQFVEWPASAFASPDAPFAICVLGPDPFGPELDSLVRGESVNRRPFVIERYRSIAQLRNCNILYIDRSQLPDLARIRDVARERSILTVTDAEGGDQEGVVIHLVTQDHHIRLRIDVGAAKASHLTISSKLLRPAEIIGSGEG